MGIVMIREQLEASKMSIYVMPASSRLERSSQSSSGLSFENSFVSVAGFNTST